MDFLAHRGCFAGAKPGVINHLKIVIGDNVDAALDTNVLIEAHSLETDSGPAWKVTVDPVVQLDPATHRATITGTVRDCNREFFVYSDPEVQVAQVQADGRAYEAGSLPGVRCVPGQIIPWSVTTRTAFGPRYLAPGPAEVKVYDVAYELDGTERGIGKNAAYRRDHRRARAQLIPMRQAGYVVMRMTTSRQEGSCLSARRSEGIRVPDTRARTTKVHLCDRIGFDGPEPAVR